MFFTFWYVIIEEMGLDIVRGVSFSILFLTFLGVLIANGFI